MEPADVRWILYSQIANFDEPCSHETIEAILVECGFKCTGSSTKQRIYVHPGHPDVKITVPYKSSILIDYRKLLLGFLDQLDDLSN